MKYLERIKVVQFFLFEQQDIPLGEITGIFGPNGSGKSSLLDAVQIAMLGANSRLVALNAQADEQATTRSLRAYCLGQFGESAEHRARDNATTYITLIWRDTETGAPLSMGVCLYASADRDGHEVLGRYILPDVELAMGDHLEVVDGEERPRTWPTFRHQLIERSRASGIDPLFGDSERYIRAALLALRGGGSAPMPEAFTRAFRFALRMRFDKTVDQIVRNDVLEARPTNIKKFKEVTESFRRLADMVAEVEAKIADGERVSLEYDKALLESRRATTWNGLAKMAEAQAAGTSLEQARRAHESAEEAVCFCEKRKAQLELEAANAKKTAHRARKQREEHAAHKDYGALQTAIQTAQGRAKGKRNEIANNIHLLHRALSDAARSEFLESQDHGHQVAISALDSLKSQISADAITRENAVATLRPALRTANGAFNALFAKGSHLKRDIEKASEELGQAQQNLERVRTGRAPLLPDVQRLMTELSDHGVRATPVCDLVRISNPQWQPVMESYLRNNMEALLVAAEQESEAFRLYRGLTGPRAVYGAKIAMESRQSLGQHPDQGTVAALIEGDNPAAVAYLQRLFGDLRCADTDKEALAGQRTLTKDGMLISSGEIERLRPVPATRFRIGAGSIHHRSAVEKEVADCQAKLEQLKTSEKKLDVLINTLRLVAHEESALKFVTDMWAAMEDDQHEVDTKTEQLKGAADADYVQLGEQEKAARESAESAEERLRDVMLELGGAVTKREQSKIQANAAQEVLARALDAATLARQHPDVDKEFESRQLDMLNDIYADAYPAMIQHANDQEAVCRRRMTAATSAGSRELGTFLEKYREHAPQEVSTDWIKAREWLKTFLKQLHDTQLATFREDMDEAYRTSQETFRNDVAIALNNHLEWLSETMDRLNEVLRECPAFSNGERYFFRRTPRPQLSSLLKFVKDVAAHGPTDDLLGGPGDLPEEFKALLEDKVAPGATGVRSPLDDYREFFDFEVEILREDPLTKATKVVGHLSKRIGPGSGGEHRAPLYVIAGAALASAYRLDSGNKDGLRLMLIDEAFNKMDPTNIIATMRYLEDLGLQVFMASPGENLGILTAFLNRYYDILRDVDNNAIMIEGREVLPETRALFREDLPEFNPDLVDEELAAMRNSQAHSASVAESV